MTKKLFTLVLLSIQTICQAQDHPPYASWNQNELTLNNGLVKRVIQLPKTNGAFLTTFYAPVGKTFKYFPEKNTDFQFEVDDTVYNGRANWQLLSIGRITDEHSGDGVAVTLRSEDKRVGLTISYLLYPGSPGIHKNLIIENLTQQDMRLESVDIEKFEVVEYFAKTFSWIYHDYGRRNTLGPYEGNMQDALVIVHNNEWKQGMVIGNEISGVLKRTAVFWEKPDICTGFTHKNNLFPFRKWLRPGDRFTTPQVFTMLYADKADPSAMLNTAIPYFVNKFMGTRLSRLAAKPTFVYNTWVPFQKNINEALIRELAKSAADAGMKEFIIDDGWQDNYGDWGVDKKKFPNGLKPVFDYVKSLGMKPGLWVSIGSATSDSKVFKAHPEWFVRDKYGQLTSLQSATEEEKYTACFSTGWYDYIKKVLSQLTVDYGLEYLKLDFAVVSSAYRYDHTESGCYATNHPHRDHHESMYMNYERMWQLMDELHAAKNNLFIDCTFEAMGGLQLIDYAMLKHAEGNWLSNFSGPDAKVDLLIRNMAWWRSPAMPATSLVIGNPEMQDAGWLLHLKSLAGALPIMLGDPRLLSPSDFQKYRSFAHWLQAMDNKYDIMAYRQDLPGFGEPTEGMWDGFERLNTENGNGGIIGVFRHGTPDMERTVFVDHLNPERLYEIRTIDGQVLRRMSGFQLEREGLRIRLEKFYDGELFEIGAIK